ncbi:MAG TPA: lysylphosphatidylglycerol synthase transmembrane domain-containing protein [Gaiella sp.]|nr:lysylphosphatidylglycerol synthase transmembrane domain-containing protein [Gaiella sp.]
MTVVPESAVPHVIRGSQNEPQDRSRRTMWIAAVIGIPASAAFLFMAVRGADLDAVWQTLQDVRFGPLALAVACMGVVYWLQAARWRKIAATRASQRQFFGMVVSGVAVNNILPGRVGDLFRARWVSRGAYSGGRGLATVVIDRGFDLLVLAVFLVATLPLVTDEPWVDRIVVGSVFVLLALWFGVLAARSYTRRRPRARRPHRGLARRFARDTLDGLSEPLGASRVTLLALSLGAWLAWAAAAILTARAVGIDISLVDAVFVTAAINLGVAIPSSPGFVGTYQWLGVSALALFGIGQEAALAFAIAMQAVWYVPTTLVGAVLLVARYSSPRGRSISPS